MHVTRLSFKRSQYGIGWLLIEERRVVVSLFIVYFCMIEFEYVDKVLAG